MVDRKNTDILVFGDGQRFEVAQTGNRPSDRKDFISTKRRSAFDPVTNLGLHSFFGFFGIIVISIALFQQYQYLVLAFRTGFENFNLTSWLADQYGLSIVSLIAGLVLLLTAAIIWRKDKKTR